MEMLDFMRLGGSLSKLRMSSDTEDFAPLFEMLGISGDTGANLLKMLRMQAKSDDQLVTEFMKEGGLMRALASPDKRVERQHVPVQCPHCHEVIIL